MHVSTADEYARGYVTNQTDSLLFQQIKRIKKQEFNKNRIDELILVTAKKNPRTAASLERILDMGFNYNGRHYVRFGKSASQGKNGVTVFVEDEIYDELMRATQLDVAVDECVISKYEAQRCLVFSNCTILDGKLPYIVIIGEYEKDIPDQHIRYVQPVKKKFVDPDTGEVHEYTEHTIVEGYKDISISPFDGCGCHDISLSERAKEQIGCDHTPIGLQIRLPFFKGFSVAFPFKEWYRERGVDTITDVFGHEHKVEDVDCIWNTTMFKAYKLFKAEYGDQGWIKYIETLEKYEYHLGISKYSHHTDKINTMARLNFQYIQCLDLWNTKYTECFNEGRKNIYDILAPENAGPVIQLAKYSTDLFERISKGDKLDSLLMLGIHESGKDNLTSKYIEACMINDNMFEDVVVKRFLYGKIKSIVNQMKLGKVYAKGFYHTVVGDMIGYLEYAAGLPVIGYLEADEFFCKTMKAGPTLSFRSPLMCPSEVNSVTLRSGDEYLNKWFGHFVNQDVVMINMYDISLPQQGGIGSVCPL